MEHYLLIFTIGLWSILMSRQTGVLIVEHILDPSGGVYEDRYEAGPSVMIPASLHSITQSCTGESSTARKLLRRATSKDMACRSSDSFVMCVVQSATLDV
jgi:hypothetical protein